MIVAHDIASARDATRAVRARRQSIGCVPTMGALHAGHISLLDAARRSADFVAATIFVNPTQFAPHEDLAKYPRPIDDDLAACRKAGADLVFAPVADEIYPRGFSTFVEVEGLSSVLEGAHRPGHFRGVTTVVLKLFNILQPDMAFLGHKDYQQQLVIRKMCADLNLPIEIRVCPTIREPDGLALSSRNRYLSPAARQKALALSQSLRLGEKLFREGKRDVNSVAADMLRHLTSISDIRVDYVTVVHPKTLEELREPLPSMVALVAARVGETRLIDNLAIDLGSET